MASLSSSSSLSAPQPPPPAPPLPRPLGEGSTIHFSRGRSVTLYGDLSADQILRIIDDDDNDDDDGDNDSDGKKGGVSWLYLNPEANFPEAAREKVASRADGGFAVVPSVPPLQAQRLDDALSRAEELLEEGRKNLVVQCSTAQRAGALAAALVSPSSPLSLARSAPFKFANNPGVFSWLERWSSEQKKNNNELPSPLFLRQLFEPASSTFTYLLADVDANEAVLIDPVRETAERDFKLIEELGFDLVFAINTHVHADHVTGTKRLRELFVEKKERAKAGNDDDADVVVPLSVISKEAGAAADVLFEPDSDALVFGRFALRPLATPGHTRGCSSFYLAPDEIEVEVGGGGGDVGGGGGSEGGTTRKIVLSPGRVFTGDTLLIRGCGRTDFQGGSSRDLFDSVRSKLFSLPDDTVVFPAHDYRGFSSSRVAEEKKFNPRLNLRKTEDEFVEIMESLNLPRPKAIDEAVPLNLRCGEQ